MTANLYKGWLVIPKRCNMCEVELWLCPEPYAEDYHHAICPECGTQSSQRYVGECPLDEMGLEVVQ